MERKRSDSKRTISSEETSSDELMSSDDYQIKDSRESVGENSQKEETINLKMTFLKSREKQHFSKKNERTSKRKESSKKKGFKRMHSSEEVSSDELVNADGYQTNHSQANGKDDGQKEQPRKLEKKGTRLIFTVPEQDSSKKRYEENLRRNKSCKKEANKRIASEEDFSSEFVNIDLSQVLHDNTCTRSLSKGNNSKEATTESERKRPSSKSPEENFYKTAEKFQRKTRCSERNASKNVNYCEDSALDELVSDDISRNHLHSHATGADSRLKETTISSKSCTEKGYNEISNSTGTSLEDLCSDVIKTDTEDIVQNVNKYLKELPSFSTSTDCPDVSKPAYISPFNFWGKSSESGQNFGVQHRKDDTEAQDSSCARKFPKVRSKEFKNKIWEELKVKMLQGNNKKARNSGVNNAQSGSSFHDERNLLQGEPGSSASHNKRKYLEGEPGSSFHNERNSTEDKQGTSSYGNEGNHLEGEQRNSTFHEERNNLEEAIKYKGTIVENIVLRISKNDDPEPGSSSSIIEWWSKAFNKTNKTTYYRSNLGQKESTQVKDGVSAKAVNYAGVKKETKEFTVLNEESKDSSTSRIDDAQPEISLHYQRNDAEPNLEHERDGSKTKHVACVLYAPKPLNSDKTVKNDGVKRKSLKYFSLQKQKVTTPKIDDAEETDKVFAYESSNENIVDQNISPVTGQNKGVSKRLSDQSDPLKENRQRPSI